MVRRFLSTTVGALLADVLAAAALAALIVAAVLLSGEASDFIYIDF